MPDRVHARNDPGGLATPTEAASCGAFGATLLALVYRRLTFAALKNAAISTMVTSSMVLLLAVASNVFGAVFTKLGAAGLITTTLVGLPWPDVWKLGLVMVLIFILGLAIRVAGDRPGVPADFPAGG